MDPWPRLAPLARLSLFHYFQPLSLLTEDSLWELKELAAIALGASLAATFIYERRDL